MQDLTWTCHVCGEVRPDNRISVFSIERPIGTSGVVMLQNVRYCNDRTACIEGASTVDFMKSGTNG